MRCSTVMLRASTLCACVLVQAWLCAADTAPGPAPAPDPRDNKLEAELFHHFQHLTYVADFACREPQPRVVSVETLLSSATTWGKAYFPDVTVIHMCEGAGACSSGYRCGPSHVHSAHLPFKVTYLEDIEYHKKGSWSMEFHLVENHTHCACAEDSTTERPKPMNLNNNNTPLRPPNPNFNPNYNPNPNYNSNPNFNPNPNFNTNMFNSNNKVNQNSNSNFNPNVPSPIRPPIPIPSPLINSPSRNSKS